jgi:hypothetical protein
LPLALKGRAGVGEMRGGPSVEQQHFQPRRQSLDLVPVLPIQGPIV